MYAQKHTFRTKKFLFIAFVQRGDRFAANQER
jgi:hypothetical protein